LQNLILKINQKVFFSESYMGGRIRSHVLREDEEWMGLLWMRGKSSPWNDRGFGYMYQ